MTHGSAAPADATPISADKLLANTLQDAVNAYLCGDYHVAHERVLDALAISRDRADTVPFIAFATTLGGLLASGSLNDHDPAPAPVDPRRI